MNKKKTNRVINIFGVVVFYLLVSIVLFLGLNYILDYIYGSNVFTNCVSKEHEYLDGLIVCTPNYLSYLYLLGVILFLGYRVYKEIKRS